MALKRSSFLFLFKLKTDGLPFPLIIPFPLFILEDFLQSLDLLFKGFIFLFPHLHKRINHLKPMKMLPLQLNEIFPIIKDLLVGLRSQGPFTLLEIHDGDDTKITIKLL